MADREQGRRACGKARRCTVGLALVSVVQLLATAAAAAGEKRDRHTGRKCFRWMVCLPWSV